MNLVLIGLRGSGKSTVGPLVAARLGVAFVDLDAAVARDMGCRDAAECWTRFGKPAFRAAETKALAMALQLDRIVIALGGGTPTAPGAADLLLAARAAGSARIIYLRADEHELRRRLSAADPAQRPSLTGGDPLAEIGAVLAARDPLYTMLATDIVEVGGLNPEAVVAHILSHEPPCRSQ